MDNPAFSRGAAFGPAGDFDDGSIGMSLKEYAAIHLKVPQSGNAELDAMIRESRRLDLAKVALNGFMSNPTT